MSRLFALLTGVKDYHPQSRVRSLTGCVNDVNNIATWLQKRFAANDLQIKKLLNEEATRQGVIDTFISHLINNPDIKPGDIVLFYYSGHGSFATSNPAFSEWDSEGKDETLVLYDSRCTGNFDLADKELRLLLSRIPAHASIVVIVDSCHSGSITRNINDLDQILLGQAKHQPAHNNDPGKKLSVRVDLRWSAENNRLEPSSIKALDYRDTVNNLSKWNGRLNIGAIESSADALLQPGMTDLLRKLVVKDGI